MTDGTIVADVASGNVAALVPAHARRHPGKLALVVPRAGGHGGGEECLTYGDLHERIQSFRSGLERHGLGEGRRVVVLLPASADLFALLLAIAASGTVAVLVDAALPPRRLLQAIARARADAIVSVRRLLSRWLLLPPLWRLRRFCFEGRSLGVSALEELAGPPGDAPVRPRDPDDAALVGFTSGTTGPPKGVERPHGILTAQHGALRTFLSHEDGDVDMPCFPVLALLDLCLGLTAVLPPVDLRAPGSADGAAVLDTIRRHGVTSLAAAPAFLERLLEGLGNEAVPRVRRLVVGGAPVHRRLCARLGRAFPEARADVVYGSSEAEPIAAVPVAEVAEAGTDGYLVGRPVPPADVARVALPGPPEDLGPEGLAPHLAAPGEPGEVLVRGPHVTRRYAGDPDAERRHKRRDPDGTVWHRTGDVGRTDGRGRLWLTGRLGDLVVHRGGTLEPLWVESVVRDRPGVAGAALICHAAAPEGELCIELDAGTDEGSCTGEARAALAGLGIASLPVVRVARLPVDSRHNSKVDRVALRALRERGVA